MNLDRHETTPASLCVQAFEARVQAGRSGRSRKGRHAAAQPWHDITTRSSMPAHPPVCPPQRKTAPPGELTRLVRRVCELLRPARQTDWRRFDQAHGEFRALLADLRAPGAAGLRQQIDVAYSLYELWHLRAVAFDQIAREHSQNEAERRLARLNRHFPARSGWTDFAPLAS